MRKRAVLITNNPGLCRRVRAARQGQSADCAVMVTGSSWDVLVAVRDEVHFGGRLLTHPLCGNLRPHQQPFRSVLIKKENNKMDSLVDLESLSMIEEALLAYQRCGGGLLLPQNLPEAVREDYALVDAELMRESLARYGLLPAGNLL